MSEEVQTNAQEVSQEASQAPSVTPEEQQAIDRYRQSQQTSEERNSGMPDGYNEDGTPKEELIGGKFKTQEDLLNAYNELQKKLGQPREEPKADPVTEPQDAGKPVEQVDFSVTEYEKEFAEKGKLSDKSYSDLEAKGFTRSQVDAYIKGQEAFALSLRNEIHNSVGGQEAYTQLIQWASANMDPAAIKEYNDAVDSLDQPRIMRALEYMNLKHGQNQPREARRLEGDSAAGGIQPYANKNDWQRDMTSRLYGKDPKFTNMVDQRYLAARKKGIL